MMNKLHPQNDFLGLTITLMTDKFGNKIGKSAGCNLWLDSKLTSPFDIYQYFYNLDKEALHRIAMTLTFVQQKEIDDLFAAPGNEYQRFTAKEALATLYDEHIAEKSAELSEKLSKSIRIDNPLEYSGILSPARGLEIFDGQDSLSLMELLESLPASPSRSVLKRLAQSNGLYLNGRVLNTHELYNGIADQVNDCGIVCLGRASPYLLKRADYKKNI